MSVSSRSLDRFATTFDHEGLVANAGLILAATLMDRLGHTTASAKVRQYVAGNNLAVGGFDCRWIGVWQIVDAEELRVVWFSCHSCPYRRSIATPLRSWEVR